MQYDVYSINILNEFHFICVFFLQANLLTYAVWGSVLAYIVYNIPMIKYVHCPKPDPVASDKVQYDRKTKSYVQ